MPVDIYDACRDYNEIKQMYSKSSEVKNYSSKVCLLFFYYCLMSVSSFSFTYFCFPHRKTEIRFYKKEKKKPKKPSASQIMNLILTSLYLKVMRLLQERSFGW